MTVLHHDAHPADQAATAALREQLQQNGAPELGPEGRAGFDEMMLATPPAEGVGYEGGAVGGVSGWWCRPKAVDADAPILLYVHGGGYVMGSAAGFCHYVGHIAGRAGMPAFIPDYALAPERPFPQALQDVLAAYRALGAAGHAAIRIAGDSAGGGLALVLLAAATRDPALPRPACAVVVSPLTDMATTGGSMESRAAHDPLVSREVLEPAARAYLGDRDRTRPDVSPLYGNLSGLPPVLLHVGEDEVLLDDTLRYAAKVEAAGGRAAAHVWQGMPHVFTANLGMFEAAADALDITAAFLRDPK